MTNAIKIDEKQYELIQQYIDMLETIEDALDYVTASFTDIEKTEGGRVLADVFGALGQVSESNKIFRDLFSNRPEFITVLEEFETVIDQALELNGHFQESNVKEEIVKGKLSPAFSDWRLKIDRVMKPLLNN
ncbi:hypothetical protein HP456_04220 [Bacillus haikouensis]|uniref:hypothetical protein n=1 Tax=Bacillus haikouensis TaxID=1510468 RepID=UPI001551782A|nr:hypothetical protein [Bacillus haikouensis]NQD65119.1 hypothetical protein [Bacillus haikouensis]